MPGQSEKVRVAAVQFAVGDDEQENLATCLRMIDEAAKENPRLMVLPEFLNHVSWWRDQEHAYSVSIDLEGPFIAAIAAKAREHDCYIMVNCTVRRRNNAVTGTNILLDPNGKVAATSDKQVLMGNENNFLERAREVSPILDTPIGRVGMYACMDGMMNETPRGLALRGAQILCNSLNSFSNDEASLHIPVRAAENKVFVVAANKIGPLVPADQIEAMAARLKIPAEKLHGGGESQIVAPDGTVLAIASLDKEGVAVADIDVSAADDKQRPDATDVFAARRPDLYGAFAEEPGARDYTLGAAEIEAAVYQPEADGEDAIAEAAEVAAKAFADGVALVVLPELFFLPGGKVGDPSEAATLSEKACAALQEAAEAGPGNRHIVASIVVPAGKGWAHEGVVIGAAGVLLRQRELHGAARHGDWADTPGDALQSIELPWGRLALAVGGDTVYPETFRLAALQNVEVVAAPTQILEAWELGTGLLERAAENRMNVVAASRPSEAGASAIIALDKDFTLWTEWSREFNGDINHPIVTRASGEPGLTRAPVYPALAENRIVTLKTDVVDSRPWWLLDAITSEQLP